MSFTLTSGPKPFHGVQDNAPTPPVKQFRPQKVDAARPAADPVGMAQTVVFCPNCRGTVEFSPGEINVVCPFCDHVWAPTPIAPPIQHPAESTSVAEPVAKPKPNRPPSISRREPFEMAAEVFGVFAFAMLLGPNPSFGLGCSLATVILTRRRIVGFIGFLFAIVHLMIFVLSNLPAESTTRF
jgi:hypothetical protein